MKTRAWGVLVLVCCWTAGCDIPTAPPIIEQRWVIPVEESKMGVEELLPAGVTVSGANFDIEVDPFSASESLGTLCAPCVALNGSSAPVPAFSGSFSAARGMPEDVESATVESGVFEVSITNGFSFDPLAGGGTVTVRMRNGTGGPVIGSLVLDDADVFTAGTTVTRTLDIGPATVGPDLYLDAEVDSPGGQIAEIDIADGISVDVVPVSLLVSSATVNVTGKLVEFENAVLDVDGIDTGLTDWIQAGAIVLNVQNPFGMSVTNGTVQIGTTSKPFALSASTLSTITLPYTGDELRSFLGQEGVAFSGSGTAAGGSITVAPGQEMTIDATLDVILHLGEGEDDD